MSWLRRTPIAHRGLHGGARPENSHGAFAAAIAAGYAIELDVHLLADGAVAVFHDETLQRMTGAPGRVVERTRATLAPLRLAGGDEPVPLLDAVLEQVAGAVPLLVELKQPEGARIGPLEDALVRGLAGYRGELAVQSFNPLSIAYLARREPALARGQLSGSFAGESLAWHKKALLKRLMLCPLSRPSFIAYEQALLPYWAPTLWCRLLGVPLIAWTVRDEQTLRRVAPLCDNVIFESLTREQLRGPKNS